MPTYISLVNWTDQGIRELKESPARADATAEPPRAWAEAGPLYWTVGPYDIVGIFEALRRRDGDRDATYGRLARAL
jgi:uncharacterized protein with GYD domain